MGKKSDQIERLKAELEARDAELAMCNSLLREYREQEEGSFLASVTYCQMRDEIHFLKTMNEALTHRIEVKEEQIEELTKHTQRGKRGRPSASESVKQNILRMVRDGMSYSQISMETGVSKATISRYVRADKEE